jgi:tetratricopeptide (TPR) repeat protein
MTTDSFTDRLSEYLDEELSSPERAAVDAHLAQCVECRSTLEDLRGVVSEAALLLNVRPARDLWSGIAARIAPGGLPRAHLSPFRRAITSRLSFTLPQLAAAGLALMVLSGGLVWMARSGDPRADFEPVNAESVPRSQTPITGVNFADQHYDTAIADLERTFEAGRTKLDPETVRVVEQNLGAIDLAIDQCRRALAADPANVYLNTHLANARQRKLALLRRATMLRLGS